jgi:WD40 repeat protein
MAAVVGFARWALQHTLSLKTRAFPEEHAMAATRFVSITGIFLAVVVCSITAQPNFSDWSEPVNLGPFINSSDNEAGPALSKDRLSLYFSSNRPGGRGLTDLYVSQRNSVKEPWGTPLNLDVVNSNAEETSPNISRDGHWLFFMSRRAGSLANAAGVIGFDIWVSYRAHVHDDFDWQPPFHLEPPVNSSSFDQSPFFFENEDAGVPQLFFTRTTPISGNDIFVSNLLPDGTFGPPTLVSELNSAVSDAGASVRFDGLEVFFFSRRPGLGNSDLWTSTRDSVFVPWSTPVNLGGVNSVALDFDPHIDSSREALYFTSDRAGGVGGQDLYVTTRTKQKPAS